MTSENFVFLLGEMVAHKNGFVYFIVGIQPDGRFDLGVTPDGAGVVQSSLKEFFPIQEATNAIIAEALTSGEISGDQFIDVRLPTDEDGASARTALSSLGPALWSQED